MSGDITQPIVSRPLPASSPESNGHPAAEAAAPRGGGRSRVLTEGPIFRTLFFFSLPMLAGNVLQSANGSINAIWVGRLLGEQALAATSNANLILFLLLGLVFGVGMASTILIGQAMGAGDLDRAKRAVGAGIGFFLCASLVVALAGFLLTPTMLEWLGTPAAARPLAEAYLRVIFLAMPFLFLSTFLSMALRGAGDARTSFLFMALAAALDVGLNPLLIAGLGPFPRLGIAGAAAATLLAQILSIAALLAYVYARKLDLRLTGEELRYLRPDFALVRTMVAKGLPMGLQMLVISSSALIMIAMVNAYGAETVAAYGVAAQIWTYVQMPAMAVGAAVSAMAAQNIGAGRWDRVERTTLAGVGINVVLTSAIVVVVYLVDPLLLGVFLPGAPSTVAIAERINAAIVWSFVPFGVMFVLFGVIRATGAVTAPLVILAISLFGVRTSAAIAFEPRFGEAALWWSFPASMIVACVLAALYYRYGKWREARMGPAGAHAHAPAALSPP